MPTSKPLSLLRETNSPAIVGLMQEIRDITTQVWPSVKAMAGDIGESYETARKWLQRGRIPERVWPILIRKSAHTAKPLTADTLMKLNQPRKKRGEGGIN